MGERYPLDYFSMIPEIAKINYACIQILKRQASIHGWASSEGDELRALRFLFVQRDVVATGSGIISQLLFVGNATSHS